MNITDKILLFSLSIPRFIFNLKILVSKQSLIYSFLYYILLFYFQYFYYLNKQKIILYKLKYFQFLIKYSQSNYHAN